MLLVQVNSLKQYYMVNSHKEQNWKGTIKCHYNENHMFSIEAILKQSSSLYEKKNAV